MIMINVIFTSEIVFMNLIIIYHEYILIKINTHDTKMCASYMQAQLNST